ncbi:MAG TPA: HNH endonuclease signature motif containing protein [Acidobacteriaceae bacterium]
MFTIKGTRKGQLTINTGPATTRMRRCEKTYTAGVISAVALDREVRQVDAILKGLLFSRSIPSQLRTEVLERMDSFCEMCGATSDDIDDTTGQKVWLRIEHVVSKKLGGRDELSNLRARCSTCDRGIKQIAVEKPSAIWLLSQVRRAGQDEQRSVLAYLLNKFGDGK